MAGIINVVKWDAAPGVFAWKFPSDSLSSWTQLIVNESQEAVMFKEGRAVGPFPAGRHVLSSDNFPMLKELYKIPFGRTPYTAEVWFVQKAFKLNIPWGTTTPIQMEDPQYHIMLPVRAFGQYGITISQTTKFLLKLVGTLPCFTEKTIVSYFKGIIITKVKDVIAKYLVDKKISILKISANLSEISQELQKQLSVDLNEYGLKIVNFNVSSISTNDEDPAVKKLRDAMASRAEMEIMGYNYQQKRSFDTMEAAAQNPSGGNGLMNAGIGLGVGMGLGTGMGKVATNMSENLTTGSPQGANPLETVICASCGGRTSRKTKFCSECGKAIRVCSKCGKDNLDNAYSCASCGAALPTKCKKCGSTVEGGQKFCPQCGQRLFEVCTKCGTSVRTGVKFCPDCGTKIENNE